MTDPTQLARSLTKAQRQGLAEAWRTPAGRMAVGERCEGKPLQSLENAGLVDAALCLTPLGLAVREVIPKEQGDAR